MTTPHLSSIRRVFDDPMLELIRLLGEAAEVEHALALQYLYMAFSVKDEFSDVKGFPKPGVGGLFGIAVEEMIHLGRVNRILVQLGAAPVMHRQDFPYEPEFYPFEFKLEPLSGDRLVAFILTEASNEYGGDAWKALKPCQQTELLALLEATKKKLSANRLGVLYGALGELLAEPALQICEDVRSSGRHALRNNVLEGEASHFNILVGIWHKYFGSDASPHTLTLTGDFEPTTNGDPLQSIVKLTDKIYWLICGLLHLGYLEAASTVYPDVKELATSLMMRALFPLGRYLATKSVGLKFADLSLGYSFGGTPAETRALLLVLTAEIFRDLKSLTAEAHDSLPWGSLQLVFRDLSLALRPPAETSQFQAVPLIKLNWQAQTASSVTPLWRQVDGVIGTTKYKIIVAPTAPKDSSDAEIRAYQLFWRSLHATEEKVDVANSIDIAPELRLAWAKVVESYLGSIPSLQSFAINLQNAYKTIYANNGYAYFEKFSTEMVLYQNGLVAALFASLAQAYPRLSEAEALNRLFIFFGSGTLGILDSNLQTEHIHLMDGTEPHYNYGTWHALNWAGQLAQNKYQLEPWQQAMPRALGVLKGSAPRPVNQKDTKVLEINRYPTDNDLARWGCLKLPEQFALEQWIHERVK